MMSRDSSKGNCISSHLFHRILAQRGVILKKTRAAAQRDMNAFNLQLQMHK